MKHQQIELECEPRPDVFIADDDDDRRRHARTLAISFRRAGIACEIDFLGRSLDGQMRETGGQRIVSLSELASERKNQTARP